MGKTRRSGDAGLRSGSALSVSPPPRFLYLIVASARTLIVAPITDPDHVKVLHDFVQVVIRDGSITTSGEFTIGSKDPVADDARLGRTSLASRRPRCACANLLKMRKTIIGLIT